MSFGVTVKYFQIRSWESHACAQFLLMSDMSPLPPLSFGRKHLLSRFELRPYYGWKPDISDRARFSTGSRQRFGNLQPSALSLARFCASRPPRPCLGVGGREVEWRTYLTHILNRGAVKPHDLISAWQREESLN